MVRFAKESMLSKSGEQAGEEEEVGGGKGKFAVGPFPRVQLPQLGCLKDNICQF